MDSTLVADRTLFVMSEIIQVGGQGLKASEIQIDTMQAIINDMKLQMTGFRNIVNAKDEIIRTHIEDNATLVSDKKKLNTKVETLLAENKALTKSLRRKSIGMWTGISGTVLITVPIIVLVTTSR